MAGRAVRKGRRLAGKALRRLGVDQDPAQGKRPGPPPSGGVPVDGAITDDRLIADLRRRVAALEQQRQDLSLFRSAVSLGLGQAGNPIPGGISQAGARQHVLSTMKSLGSEAVLARDLEHGRPLDLSVIHMVRSLLAQRQHVRARSIGHSLLNSPETRLLGHAAVGLVAMYQKLYELAEHHFTALDVQTAVRLVPAEWLDFRFRQDPDQACRDVSAHPDATLASDSLRFFVVMLAVRERRDVFAREQFTALVADRGDAPDLEPARLEDYRWMRHWMRLKEIESHGQPDWRDGAVNIGILDYKQPDFLRQSSNIGDYIQTIGALTHVARFQNLGFRGDADVTGTLEVLQKRTNPTFRADLAADTEVNVVRVDRDDTHRNHLPANTWLVAFGWYMHTPFDGSFDFPFADNINPIFISFHVNRREMLTDEAVAYLKEHAPVGCRDWTTVYLLRSLGVPAFFSGCLTTTVSAVFSEADGSTGPAAGRAAGRVGQRVAVVDKGLTPAIKALIPAGATVETITQADPSVGWSGMGDNVEEALELLERYRGFDRIITSRLHCYLPATALGCPVDFTPGRQGDVRFDGLLDMTPGSPALAAIQDGIRSKLEAVYRSILSGAGKDEVYALWRQITAEDVAAAEAHCSRPFTLPEPQFDVGAACETILAGRRDFGAAGVNPEAEGTGEDPAHDTVHVALATDQNLRAEVPVVVQSILSGSSRPVHFWVLTRGLDDAYFSALAETFPETSFTFLPCDEVHYGEIAGMLKHITVSTMDRLLLPLLMPDLDRIIYHDIDAVTVADIAELYATDMTGTPLAGRSSKASWAESGFGNVYRAANRLDAQTASELRRGMHDTMEYDFTTFNAGILVMDLATMRADDFCHRYVGMAGGYGMNDQEILNCYAGRNRTVLDPRWNAVPQQEVAVDPKIIHWAGPAKPWRPEYVVHQDVWDGYVAGFEERAARAGTREVLVDTNVQAGS